VLHDLGKKALFGMIFLLLGSGADSSAPQASSHNVYITANRRILHDSWRWARFLLHILRKAAMIVVIDASHVATRIGENHGVDLFAHRSNPKF
jgi:hypothetical protein